MFINSEAIVFAVTYIDQNNAVDDVVDVQMHDCSNFRVRAFQF